MFVSMGVGYAGELSRVSRCREMWNKQGVNLSRGRRFSEKVCRGLEIWGSKTSGVAGSIEASS